MNKGVSRLCWLLCFGGLSLVACAKTVALWPLEHRAEYGALHCAINPSNDLSVISCHYGGATNGMDWALPPNPDRNRHAFTPINLDGIREDNSSDSQHGFLCNDYTARFLRRDLPFTVEGYIKLLDVPASNKWACIISAFTQGTVDSGNLNRWTLSLRRRSNENYACSWIFWGERSSDTVLYRYESEEASYAITNTWMHLALVHEPLDASHYDHWKFYINGVKIGESSNYGLVVDGIQPAFDLGARRFSNNGIDAVFDYWRISDQVLSPNEFLCAGESGNTIPTSPTVSYWPLGVTEAGDIDCRDAVGTSPLTGGFQGTDLPANRMTPTMDCAFAGDPPNPTVTLPEGNVGSFQGCAGAACLKVNGMGSFFNVTSNFTVECWIRPRLYERTPKSPTTECVAYLFGTRTDYGKGWALQYRAKGIDNIQFDLYCYDSSNALIHNRVLSGSYDVKSWYEKWRHVALVYDATAGENGYGCWTFYIDGEAVGTVSNSRAPVPITDSRPFFVGGRDEVALQSFQGAVDCVRVSATALTPTQFLNATDGTAATDVLALWPLNVKNGFYPDLRDVSGAGRHFVNLYANYNLALVTPDREHAPTISNPDQSPNFHGEPQSVQGSVRFRYPTADVDRKRSCLATGSSTVLDTLAAGRDFTFECYYRHAQPSSAMGTSWQENFLVETDTSNLSPTVRIRFFRKKEGFYIWESRNCNLSDTKFANTGDDDLEYDRWYHVALVHRIESINDVLCSVWRLYLDGELKGEASATYNGSTGKGKMAYVGGRFWYDNNSIIGNLSSVRLSNCALAPEDFLCATPAATPTVASTAGYWPVDANEPKLANLVDAEYPLEASGTAVAQAAYARLSIPNRTALAGLVTGGARQNRGSYALGEAGTLCAASVGFEMTGTKSFTIEGWLKWTPNEGTADEDLVSVGHPSTADGGLRIYFDMSDSTPKLRVFGRGSWPCTPYVDGAFDADFSSYIGKWTHIAVVYHLGEGDHGTWTLYIEGEQVGGKIKNFFHATPIDYVRSGELCIGSFFHPLNGSVDMWRLTMAPLDASALLYAPPSGTFLFFR